MPSSASRADASLPYTLPMAGFGLGGLLTTRLVDRVGVMPVPRIGAVGLGLGFAPAARTQDVVAFAIVHGVPLGLLGSSTTFAALVADAALWFARRRGIAVAICASGNRVAGAFWQPSVQAGLANWGWRDTCTVLGLLCPVTMVLLSLYVVSALFGLFQGGIVPSYASIVREHLPAAVAGARTGAELTATLFGVAPGGWTSGKVFDLTGSYDPAFADGIAWNALNLAIAGWLLWRAHGGPGRAPLVQALAPWRAGQRPITPRRTRSSPPASAR